MDKKIYIVQGEVGTVVGAIKRNSRWNTHTPLVRLLPSVALDPLRSRSSSVFHGARLSDGTVRSQVSTTSSTHQRERVGLALVRRVPVHTWVGSGTSLTRGTTHAHSTLGRLWGVGVGGGGRRITFRN